MSVRCPLRLSAAFLLASSALLGTGLLTGCGIQTVVTGTTEATPLAGFSGTVHGGQQPVAYASVTLWAAGKAGYGSAATSLASVNSDANGNFTFHPAAGANYACPAATSSSASQLLYITASGGQPTTAVANADSYMMLALGDCSTVLASNPFIIVNEVTTAASMFALQQFFTPSSSGTGGNIGTSATNIAGLKSAFATVNNLVSASSGLTPASFTSTAALSSFTTAPMVTITPEQSKIYTIADILASCINGPSTSTACTTLLTNVNSTAAKDTLQAAYYMATNSTSTVNGASNIGALYALISGTPPFNPYLSAAPADWTIGVTYGSNSTNTAGAYLLSYPSFLAIDAAGDVWAVNDVSATAATYNSVTELSGTGTPLVQVLTTPALTGPAYISIDQTGNVWVPNYGSSSALQTSVAEYTVGGGSNSFITNSGPQRTAIDGAGNVFVLEPEYKGLGNLEEIKSGAQSGSSAATLTTSLSTDFSNLAIDANYTVWVTGGGTSTSATGSASGSEFVYQFPLTSGAYPATPNTLALTEPENAITIDNSNNVFVPNYSKSNLAEFSGKTTITANANSPYTTTGLTTPQFGATDGLGNVWFTNYASKAGSVFEFTNAGAAIAPAAGYAHTYSGAYGIAIDPSGNVWIGNYSIGASATTAAFLTEIVGQAGPVVTPLAAGLPTTAGGTSRLGARP